MSEHDDAFDAIVQEALRQAAGVECDAAAYRAALAAWIDDIDGRHPGVRGDERWRARGPVRLVGPMIVMRLPIESAPAEGPVAVFADGCRCIAWHIDDGWRNEDGHDISPSHWFQFSKRKGCLRSHDLA